MSIVDPFKIERPTPTAAGAPQAGGLVDPFKIARPVLTVPDSVRAFDAQRNLARPTPDAGQTSIIGDVGRGIAQAGLGAARTLGLAGAGAIEAATLGNAPTSITDPIFRGVDAIKDYQDTIQRPTTTGGRIAEAAGGLVGAIPTLGVGNLSEGQDIIREGGSLGHALGQTALNAAGDMAGLGLGKIGEKAAVLKRALGQGAANTAFGEASRVAGNAIAPEERQREFDPLDAAINFGAGVGFGVLPHAHEPARPNEGATAQKPAAEAAVPGATEAAQTTPRASRFPDAQPGSLSDAANTIAESASVARTPRSAEAALDVGVLHPDSDVPSDPARVPPVAEEAPAQDTAPDAEPVEPTAPAAAAPDVPWFDPATGEMRTPSDTEVKDAWHRVFSAASDAGISKFPGASRAMAEDWGVPAERLRDLRKQALQERNDGISPENRDAKTAEAADLEQRKGDDALAALDETLGIERAPKNEDVTDGRSDEQPVDPVRAVDADEAAPVDGTRAAGDEVARDDVATPSSHDAAAASGREVPASEVPATPAPPPAHGERLRQGSRVAIAGGDHDGKVGTLQRSGKMSSQVALENGDTVSVATKSLRAPETAAPSAERAGDADELPVTNTAAKSTVDATARESAARPDGDSAAPSAQEEAIESDGLQPGVGDAEAVRAQRVDEAADHFFNTIDREIGWEERGGRLIREPDRADGLKAEVVGRTKWLGKAGPDGTESNFWRMRPDRTLSEKVAREALAKARDGKALRPVEQRFVDYSRKTAREYAVDQLEAEDMASAHGQIDRSDALQRLRDEHAQDISGHDAAEAMALVELVQRARAAGMHDMEVSRFTTENDARYAGRLWREIKNRSSENGAHEGAESGRSEGRAEGDGSRSAAAADGEISAPSNSEGARNQTQEVASSARGDLFKAPTAREVAAHAEREKDAKRNGLKGSGRTDMLAGDGELFAGRRPKQADIERGEFRQSAPEEVAGARNAEHHEAISKAIREVTDRWGENAPRVRVVDSPDRLPASAKRAEPTGYRQARGFYDGDTVYIVSHNLDRESALRTLAHESVGHYGVDRIVDEFSGRGGGGMNKLVADITRLRREGLGSTDLRAVMNDVAKRYPKADERTFAREVIAISAERNLRNGLVARAVAAIRAWARQHFPNIRFTENDLRAMLVRSARYLQEGPSQAERRTMVQAMAFDQAPATDSAAFKRFFGKSKVVDRAGEPMVVHHGTGEDFTVFEGARAGSATEHATSPLGHFFTENRALAKRYAENASEGRPADERVIDAYLSIQKPYEMTLDQAQAIETPAQARALRAKLERDGYDGIRIAEAKTWIAFESGQAKSTDNRGTFDRANPDINYSLPVSDEGPHGPVFETKNYREAVDALMQAKTGEVRSILNNKASGPVDLLWGKAGAAEKNFNDGYGLAKILAKHPEVDVYSLARELEQAKPVARTRNSWQFESPNYRIVLKRDWMGEPKTWLLTAYDPKEKPAATGSTRIGTAPASSADEIRSSQVAGKESIPPERSGDFSLPEEPFQRPRASVDALGEVLADPPNQNVFERAKEWMRGKAEDFVPAALGALQRRQLTELMDGNEGTKGYGKQYDERVQQLETDRNQLMSGAPDAAEHANDMLKRGAATIAGDLRAFTFQKGLAGWLGRKNPEAQKLADVIHAATLRGLDPSEEYTRLMMSDSQGKYMPWTPQAVKERMRALRGQMRGRPGDDKTAMMDEIKNLRSLASREKKRLQEWPALLAEYQKLSPEAKTLYRQMRDWYGQMRDATEQGLIARVEAIGRDMAGTSGADLAKRYVAQTAQRIRLQFESNRMEGVYFPLNRDGDFWVSFKDSEGTQGFKMFENAGDAAAAEKKLRGAGFTIEAQGRRDSDYRAKNAPSGTFIADVIDSLKKAGAPEKVQDEIYQMFLRTLPEMSMRKHSIHRKKIAGFEDDVLRAFSKNAFHGAHQLARLRHAHELQGIVEGAQTSMDNYRRGDADALTVARGDALLGELKKRHDFIMSPKDSQLANYANSVGFLYYMGASPASAIVNLTQNAQVTLPALGAQFGWPKATRMLGAALRDSMRTFGNLDRTLTIPEERQAYNVLRARGDIDKTQTHSLAALAEGNQLQSHPAWSRVMEGLGWAFHKAEVINREAAGMAAYRLARSRGDTFHDAIQFASDTINGTHFDYSASNRPRLMQGNVGRIAGQFKNYSVGMTWMLYRNLYQAFKAESPEVRAVARRTLTGILGMTGLMAGTVGLPTYNAMKYSAQAAHALFGDDEPYDFDVEYRKWLAENLGEDAASMVADGVVNRSGVNVARRVSLSNLWFQDADRSLEGKDAYYQMLENMAGPIGGIAKNLFVGSQMVGEGHVERGVETMLPKFAKDAFKGLRFAHEGANTLRGDPIVPDITGPEALIQAMGFQPTRLFEQQQMTSALKNYEQEILDRRQTLMNAYAMAVHAGADRDVAMEKIHTFNQRYPEIAIKSESLRQSLRARARYSAEQTGGVAINKKLAPRLRGMVGQEGAAPFAQPPG